MSAWSARRAGRHGDPHGWNSLDNYLKGHFAHLDRLTEAGEVVRDTLRYGWPRPTQFLIDGRIVCRDGLFVDVEKRLETNHAARVRTDKVRTLYYSYHAGLIGEDDRCVFRYDNAHPYLLEGHPDAHHKHRFDHRSWREIEPPEWIGAHRWPHLDQVISELLTWWDTQARDLGPNRL